MLSTDYAELHCHSHYSLLDGASSPEALVARAAALGMGTLALTDHNGLYGAVRFHGACHKAGLHPLIGAELTLQDGTHLGLLARTEEGYHNLCRLLSRGGLAGRKGATAHPLRLAGGARRGADRLLRLPARRRAPPAAVR